MPTHRSSPRALGLLIWAGTLGLALGAAYASVKVNHHGSADTPRGVVDTPSPARPGLSRLTVVDPNDRRPYGVYVWRLDVSKTRELPVLYFLHGVPSDPEALIDGEGLATRVRDWVAGGGAPFVLAVPDGNGSHHRDTEWADAADGSDRLHEKSASDLGGYGLPRAHISPSNLAKAISRLANIGRADPTIANHLGIKVSRRPKLMS